MDNGGGKGGGSFKVSSMGRMQRSTLEVHKAGAGEVKDVVGERKMRIELSK